MKAVEAFIATVRRNKWRYLSFVAGFFLFVYPFAAVARILETVSGMPATWGIHCRVCRMPFDWLFSVGGLFTLLSMPETLFWTVLFVVVAFLFGPLFCGWLCPVGSVTETLSRITPWLPKVPNLSDKLNPAAMRYGFLTGWVIVGALPLALKASFGLKSLCCYYCPASVLQQLAVGFTVDASELAYWFSGSILVLAFWLLVGGIFWKGGRGWCLYFCPIGAFQGLFHLLGSRLGFTYKIKVSAEKCRGCGTCGQLCPMWAVTVASKARINRVICIACWECITACPNKAIKYAKG